MASNSPVLADAICPDLPWWKGASIYQIYPRSFMDSNGDGIGDLAGITARLDYVARLGVDAIWISPFFKSPMKDFGYDVSDYCDIDPIFGTLADFDALIANAHSLGLKVLIDQVYSHTSDEHAWFSQSRSSRDNPRADWYVWRDAKPDGSPPNNWQSVFGGPAWTWDARRGQYYMHNFLSSQPQLNGHNREVQDALLNVARFWLRRGVDGFRIDALNFAMCDPEFRDNPPAPDNGKARTRPFDFQLQTHNMSHPDIAKFVARIRDVTDEFDAVFTVAEVGGANAETEMKAFTAGNDHLNSAYGFNFLYADKLTPALVQSALCEWPDNAGVGWPSWAFENHDAPRAVSRWCAAQHMHEFARLKMALLAALRGNIILYQGEELALVQDDIPFELLQDPEAIANWPLTLSRDGVRTPFPWLSGAQDAGFGSDSPWLPISEANKARAVSAQQNDPTSQLNFTADILRLRGAYPALLYGSAEVTTHGDVLCITRAFDGQVLHCAFNLGTQPTGIAAKGGKIVLAVNGATDGYLPRYGAIYVSG